MREISLSVAFARLIDSLSRAFLNAYELVKCICEWQLKLSRDLTHFHYIYDLGKILALALNLKR